MSQNEWKLTERGASSKARKSYRFSNPRFDRDVRATRAALAAALSGGDAAPRADLSAAVREGLGAAAHVATLLSLDDARDASDVVSKFVAPDDLPAILALRGDWPEA